MLPFNLVWLGFLTGISPWWWIALAIAIGVVEVTTMSTFLLGPAAAAGTVGVLLMIEPELSGTAQITIFGAAVLVYGLLAYVITRGLRGRGPAQNSTLNRRGQELVGREAAVEQAFDAGIGRVTVDGIGWRARLAGETDENPPQPGMKMRIAAVDGAMLVVEPIVRA
ncbi:MAG: NfeD family protein [Pseudomonadota bacterium]